MNGLENLTDFDIYKISKSMAKEDRVQLEEIKLNSCKNITVWSLIYLSESFNLDSLYFDQLQKRVTI